MGCKGSELSETEIRFKEAVDIGGIKSRIPQKGIWVEIGVGGKKIRKDRFEGSGVADGLILFGESDFFSTGSRDVWL